MRKIVLALALTFALPAIAPRVQGAPLSVSAGSLILSPGFAPYNLLRDENEKVWNYWDPSVLSDGTFTTLTDKIGGSVIAVSSNAPTVSSGTVAFAASGNQVLSIPDDSLSVRHWRSVLLIFKANVAAAPAATGTFVQFNGTHSSQADEQMPVFGYTKSGNTFYTGWSNDPTMTVTVPNPGDNVWHCELARLVQGTGYTTLDGGTDAVTSNTNFTQPRNVDRAVGNLGDAAGAHSIAWTFGGLITFQGELTNAERDSIMGWCMWKMGVQANLPGGHPYHSAPPTANPFRMPYFTNSDAYWASTITPAAFDTSHRGTALNLTGFTQIWKDDFTSTSDVADDVTGPMPTAGAGPVYPPAEVPVSNAYVTQTLVPPAGTPTVITVTGGNAVLEAQFFTNLGGDSQWYVTNMASVKYDGRGTIIDTRVAPTYFETSLKSNVGCDSGPLYVAFWLKDVTEYYYQTLPRSEFDIVEAYCDFANYPAGVSNFQHHGTYHNWPPSRIYDATRMASHHQVGEITTLQTTNTPPWPSNDNLFDGNPHSYGMLIDKTQCLMIYYVDRLETFRQPCYPDMFRGFRTIESILTWENITAIQGTTPTEFIDYAEAFQAAPYNPAMTYSTPYRGHAGDGYTQPAVDLGIGLDAANDHWYEQPKRAGWRR